VNPAQVPSGPLLIDTDVFSWLLSGRGRAEEFAELVDGHILALSFATVAELRAGALIGGWGPKRIEQLEERISAFVVIPATDSVTRVWAFLQSKLRSQLKGGGVNDMWIAASALGQPALLPIVTGNLTDFQTIAAIAPISIVHPDL
jgi:predicted nucleic acid-binding protein